MTVRVLAAVAIAAAALAGAVLLHEQHWGPQNGSGGCGDPYFRDCGTSSYSSSDPWDATNDDPLNVSGTNGMTFVATRATWQDPVAVVIAIVGLAAAGAVAGARRAR